MSRVPIPLVALIATGLMLGGCASRNAGRGGDITGSIPQRSEAQWRSEIDQLAAKYQSSPNDAANAMLYARALRGTGQSAQAVAVIERVALRDSSNMAVLGEYGRALAEVGRNDHAYEVLSRSHRADQPDWRVLNVQGTVLDSMGRHPEAQNHYNDALKISPGEPNVLANLGLSLALTRRLPEAERVLRQAVAHPRADIRARQNLALVIGLQGRFDEARQMAMKDLPPAEAEANVMVLRRMLSQPNSWAQLRQTDQRARPRTAQAPRPTASPAEQPFD
ncbi:MAG: tetratricopeptide repeat protein [Alphaproteobacteria bacterium]